MDAMLNELSAYSQAPDIVAARARMREFVEVLRALRQVDPRAGLRTPRDFRRYVLTTGYLLLNWFEDRGGVSADDRRFLLDLATRGPYLEQMWAEQVSGQVIECTHNSQAALGLGVAYLLDAPAVGLSGVPEFAADPVVLHVVCDGITERDVDVCHISNAGQVTARAEWLQQRVDGERVVADGADLWNRRLTLFGRVRLCECTKEYLVELKRGNPSVPHIVRHLRTLEDTCEAWRSGPFEPEGIEWSVESMETMKNKRLAGIRTFMCPDGSLRTFSLHTKLRAFNLRLYYYFDGGARLEQRSVVVGYIGPHLPTSGSTT